jgi:tetratricopeptide (TPR) repeat protein
MTEYTRMAQRVAHMAGEKDAANAKLSGMKLFQLPIFQALAEMPTIKDLTTAGPLGSLAVLRQPAKMAEIFTAVTRAVPDGSFLLLQGLFLMQAGRLAEAEAVLLRALESPSWADHRRAARFDLVQVQWQLASRPGASAAEQAAWKEKAQASLRAVPLGPKPLPPEPTLALMHVASACGEQVVALALAEAALRQHTNNLSLLGGKLNLEIEQPALDRAEATATTVAALVQAGSLRDRAGFDALLNLARAFHNADRPADALRWCERLREILERAGSDNPNRADAWNGLGVVYWQMKRFDASIPIFERVHSELRKSRGERYL